jgi:hypothetical protein
MGRNRPGCVEVHHLGGGVDPGVRAPRSDGLQRALAIEGHDRLFERLLDADLVILALPAMEGAAVVLQAEGDATNGTGTQTSPGC